MRIHIVKVCNPVSWPNNDDGGRVRGVGGQGDVIRRVMRDELEPAARCTARRDGRHVYYVNM